MIQLANRMGSKYRHITLVLCASALLAAATQGCAPRPLHRTPLPPPSSSPSIARTPQTPPPPRPAKPPGQETLRKPLPQEPKIQEQDLRTKRPATPPEAEQKSEEVSPEIGSLPETAPPPLPDDSSLVAKITPGTPPRRAASLRLTEEGRKLLDSGEPAKALSRLERTIAIDSTNPYGYFYLAKAQYLLGRYQESLNFLDVAESRFSSEPFWLAEVYALRGENYRAVGMNEKAEASYAQALRLNSGNQTAADALFSLQSENPSSSR